MVFTINCLVVEISVRDYIKLDDYIVSIPGLPTPLISLCFVSPTMIFVNVFNRRTQEHWYFIYSVVNKVMVIKP